MLVKLTDSHVVDPTDIAAMVEQPSAATSAPGAAFEFKPDTLITLKNGQTMLVPGKTTDDVLDAVKAGVRLSMTQDSTATPPDLSAALNDIIRLLEAIKEHVHTTSEMITRQVLTPQ